MLTTHLTEILKENMADLLSYAEMQKLLKDLPAEQKKLVDDLIPSVITATDVQRVLQALLRERVSIRDLPAILEGIGEAAPHTALGHHAGRACPRPPGPPAVLAANRADDGALPIVTLSPEWEQAFAEALIGPGRGAQLALAPSQLQDFIRGVREAFERAALAGEAPVLLTSPQIRPYVRSIIERFRGQTVVMCQNEVHARAKLKTVGSV